MLEDQQGHDDAHDGGQGADRLAQDIPIEYRSPTQHGETQAAFSRSRVAIDP